MTMSGDAGDYCAALWGERLRGLIKSRDAELETLRHGLMDRADINSRVGFLNYIQPEIDHIASVGKGRMECLVEAYALDGRSLSKDLIDEISFDAESHMKQAVSTLLKRERFEEQLAHGRGGTPPSGGGYQMEEFVRRLDLVQSETKDQIERTLKVRMYKEIKELRLTSRDPNPSLSEYVLDDTWCTRVSLRKSIPSRCPFASVDLCPRYFLSLSLLGISGITTKLASDEEARLQAKWKQHPLWPRTTEQEPAVTGSGGKPVSFSHFCPEVTYDTFGVFASSLAEYSDELDRDLAHETLGREHANRNDWRWQWTSATALHYSDCPVYAPLLQKPSEIAAIPEKFKVFEFKPNWHGISVDLPLLWRRLWAFWRDRK